MAAQSKMTIVYSRFGDSPGQVVLQMGNNDQWLTCVTAGVDVTIPKRSSRPVDTGINIHLDKTMFYRLVDYLQDFRFPPWLVLGGAIDSDKKHSLHVLTANITEQDITIKKGTIIAQIIFGRYYKDLHTKESEVTSTTAKILQDRGSHLKITSLSGTALHYQDICVIPTMTIDEIGALNFNDPLISNLGLSPDSPELTIDSGLCETDGDLEDKDKTEEDADQSTLGAFSKGRKMLNNEEDNFIETRKNGSMEEKGKISDKTQDENQSAHNGGKVFATDEDALTSRPCDGLDISDKLSISNEDTDVDLTDYDGCSDISGVTTRIPVYRSRECERAHIDESPIVQRFLAVCRRRSLETESDFENDHKQKTAKLADKNDCVAENDSQVTVANCADKRNITPENASPEKEANLADKCDFAVENDPKQKTAKLADNVEGEDLYGKSDSGSKEVDVEETDSGSKEANVEDDKCGPDCYEEYPPMMIVKNRREVCNCITFNVDNSKFFFKN